MAHLEPCPKCARHVRVASHGCPFCDAELPDAFRATPPRAPARRLARAAVFAVGTAIATTSPGCYLSHQLGSGGDAPPPRTDAGPPPVDAAIARDEGVDFGGIGVLYGPAPDPIAEDAGTEDAGEEDLGAISADYGSPP